MSRTNDEATVEINNSDVIAELSGVASWLGNVLILMSINCSFEAEKEDIVESFNDSDVAQSIVDEILDVDYDEAEGENYSPKKSFGISATTICSCSGMLKGSRVAGKN